jgi:hypothetical protein
MSGLPEKFVKYNIGVFVDTLNIIDGCENQDLGK